MNRSGRGYCSWCLWGWLVGIAVATPAAHAGMIQYSIVSDAQIDSQNESWNFGASKTAKVVVNGTDGSLARAVFQIPGEVWETPLESIVSAKVYFYVWSDQTASRNVRLHPLTQGFVEGTGNGDGTAAADGATWSTYDGSNSWSTSGGDYDAGVWVDAVKPSAGLGWFSWDISSLWNDANLRAFGAILKMSDESDPGYPNMPRAPFGSAESAAYPTPYVEIITGAASVPEPASAVLVLVGTLLTAGMVRFRSRR